MELWKCDEQVAIKTIKPWILQIRVHTHWRKTKVIVLTWHLKWTCKHKTEVNTINKMVMLPSWTPRAWGSPGHPWPSSRTPIAVTRMALFSPTTPAVRDIHRWGISDLWCEIPISSHLDVSWSMLSMAIQDGGHVFSDDTSSTVAIRDWVADAELGRHTIIMCATSTQWVITFPT